MTHHLLILPPTFTFYNVCAALGKIYIHSRAAKALHSVCGVDLTKLPSLSPYHALHWDLCWLHLGLLMVVWTHRTPFPPQSLLHILFPSKIFSPYSLLVPSLSQHKIYLLREAFPNPSLQVTSPITWSFTAVNWHLLFDCWINLHLLHWL